MKTNKLTNFLIIAAGAVIIFGVGFKAGEYKNSKSYLPANSINNARNFVNSDSWHEAHFINKVILDRHIGIAPFPLVRFINIADSCRQVIAMYSIGERFCQIAIEAQSLAKTKIGIASEDSIVMRRARDLLVDQHHPDIRVR